MKNFYLKQSLFFPLLILGINNINAQIQVATTTTDSTINITATTADVYGNITSNGGDINVQGGICYDTSPNPTTSSYFTGSYNGSFIYGHLSGLSPNTTYYVRSYAIDSAGISYGSQDTLTTTAAILPTDTTYAVANITATTAGDVYGVEGNIISDGGDPDVTGGLCYGTSSNPTIADNVTGYYYTGDGSFITGGALSGLTPNTTYYVRAYATNVFGTGYGNEVQFTTNIAVLPTVTTDTPLTSITATSATEYGTASNGGDPSITGGVCYATSPNPTIADSTTGYYSAGEGSITAFLSGLLPNTLYYVRAFATNVAGTGYGNQVQFTTNIAYPPSVVTDTGMSNITATTASGYVNVTGDGGDAGVIGGFCYSTSSNPTIADSFVKSASKGTGYQYVTVSNLLPNTIYYIRTFATNADSTTYGSQLQFTTKTATPAIVTTDSVTNITITTTYGYATLIDDGLDPGTQYGLCYSTSTNPTIANSKVNQTVYINCDCSYTPYYLLSGLTPNTKYYVKAYATNVLGTSYGSEINFTTLPVITVTATNATICAGGSTALAAAGASAYVWRPSSGLNTTSGASVIASPVVTTTYTIIGIYANGFRDTVNSTVTITPNISYALNILTTDESSTNACDGYLEAVVKGIAPYTYNWHNGKTTAILNAVCAGNYSLTVTDSRNCPASAQASVGTKINTSAVANPLSINVHTHDVSDVNLCDGTSSIRVTGGTSPYSISFAGSTVNTSNYTINNLCAGFYTVNVKDAQSSKGSFTFVVGSPATTFNSIAPKFADSVFVDTLVGDAVNNCLINYSAITSIAVQSFSFVGSDSIDVVWAINQGSASITIHVLYQYTKPGLQTLEIDLFCTNRASGSARGVDEVNIERSTTTGIKTLELSSISVYPNPFSSSFTISGIKENAHVKVFNSLGAVVYTENVISGKTEINLQSYSAGVYHVQVISNNGTANWEIIKE